jgi:hypothetical protein
MADAELTEAMLALLRYARRQHPRAIEVLGNTLRSALALQSRGYVSVERKHGSYLQTLKLTKKGRQICKE